MNFSLNVPLNKVSFGNVSVSLLREFMNLGYNNPIFPIGNLDLSAQRITPEFKSWLETNIGEAAIKHNRDFPNIKLFHIKTLMESYSKEQIAITFHEVDELTPTEVNILKNQKLTFVTSNFTKKIIESYGINNVKMLTLGFDHYNFWRTNKEYLGTDNIVFGLGGKLEKRKNHFKTLRAWAAKYGNKKGYVLHAFLQNPFLKKEDQDELISQALEGKKFYNINFLPFAPTNLEYNEVLNSCDVILGLSGGEGRDLVTFHTVGLGKHCIGLNAHAYLDYLNNENAVLINPSGKFESEDGIFFKKGSKFNQGRFFDYNIDDLMSAFDEVEKRIQSSRLNRAGLELQEVDYKDTVKSLLNEI